MKYITTILYKRYKESDVQTKISNDLEKLNDFRTFKSRPVDCELFLFAIELFASRDMISYSYSAYHTVLRILLENCITTKILSLIKNRQKDNRFVSYNKHSYLLIKQRRGATAQPRAINMQRNVVHVRWISTIPLS